MTAQPTHDEDALLQRIAKGEEAAMRVLFGRYYPRLCFYATSLLDDMEEARDIAQDALLQFWKQRQNFARQQQNNLSAYLFTIVRRDCLDHLRHRQVKRNKQEAIAGSFPLTESGIETSMVVTEVLQLIYKEIRLLPPQLAEIVQLSFIEGLSTQEIADRLHTNPNNIRVQKSRAVEKLRNALLKRQLMTPAILSAIFLEIFHSRL